MLNYLQGTSVLGTILMTGVFLFYSIRMLSLSYLVYIKIKATHDRGRVEKAEKVCYQFYMFHIFPFRRISVQVIICIIVQHMIRCIFIILCLQISSILCAELNITIFCRFNSIVLRLKMLITRTQVTLSVYSLVVTQVLLQIPYICIVF